MKKMPKFKTREEYWDWCWDSVPMGRYRLEQLAPFFPYSPLEGINDFVAKRKMPFEIEEDNYLSTVIEFPSMKKKQKYQTRRLYVK